MCANAVAQEATKCGVYVRYFLSLSIKVLLCHTIINTFLSHFVFFPLLDGYISVFQMINGYDFANGKWSEFILRVSVP